VRTKIYLYRNFWHATHVLHIFHPNPCLPVLLYLTKKSEVIDFELWLNCQKINFKDQNKLLKNTHYVHNVLYVNSAWSTVKTPCHLDFYLINFIIIFICYLNKVSLKPKKEKEEQISSWKKQI
jgi:hypothetical protein